MRPAKISLYQIDQNSRGEILVATPDLGIDANAVQFELRQNALVLYYDDGAVVHLPDVPHIMFRPLQISKKISVVEMGQSVPARAYVCERALT